MREKNYYGAIKGFCLKWNLPEVWNSDRITGANLIYEVIKVINAMILEQKEVKEMVEDFIEMLNEDIDETVRVVLTEWLNNGTLGDTINESLFNSKADKNSLIFKRVSEIDDIQLYVNENKDMTLYFEKGEYVLSEPLILHNNSIIAEEGAVIINDLNGAYGTEMALINYGFNEGGFPTNRVNLGSITNQELNVLTLSLESDLTVGDFIVCDSYIGKVVSVNGLDVTVDRSVNHDLVGKEVWKTKEILNVSVEGLTFDFNGKYGFGVKALGGYFNIKNIKGIGVASRVIEVKECLDSVIENCSFNKAIDVSAGHGYGIRVTYSDNVIVNHCLGYGLRHTVDLNSVYNCVVDSCSAYNNVTSFMTHDNGSINCFFIENKSFDATTGAYGGLDTGGDFKTTVKGGLVVGKFINADHTFLKETVVEGVRFENTTISSTGYLVLKNCEFYQDKNTVQTMIRLTKTGSVDIINSNIFLDNSKEMIYTTGGTINIRLLNCLVDVKNQQTISNTHVDCDVVISNSILKVVGKTNNTPLISVRGSIDFVNNIVEGSFENIIGGEVNSSISFFGNTLFDVVKTLFSRGFVTLKLGNNVMNNSFYSSFQNFDIETLGVVTVDTTSTGDWTTGCVVIESGIIKKYTGSDWVEL